MHLDWTRAVCALTLLLTGFAGATMPGKEADSPVTTENIDHEACAVWAAGSEHREGVPHPHQILWRANGNNHSPYGEHFSQRDWRGVNHLRYAFKESIPVGSIFCGSTCTLSVLKPGAPYPGDMNDESQWIPGEVLLRDGTLAKGKAQGGWVFWVFPEGTKTRAIRFTHKPGAQDDDPRGWINTILVMPKRVQSLGWYATAHSETYEKRAHRLNDGKDDGLGNSWSNMDGRFKEEDMPVVDKQHPGVFTLAWPQAVEFDTLLTCHTGFRSCEVDVYTGTGDPAMAREKDWSFVQAFTDRELNFPYTWPEVMRLDRKVKTRGLRVRLTEKVECGHPHVQGQNHNGKRVYLGEIFVLNTLAGSAKLAAPAFVQALNREIPPPIPVRFDLPVAANVTLVLEDKQGNRLCNLVSDKPFPAGRNTFWWDGSNDLGRDLDAANHGVLRIPEQPVPPGEYVVRGLYHQPIRPTYEFGSYISGRWVKGDRGGDWLANHGNPQAACYCPGDGLPDGRPLMFFGALVTEGPHGLIWVDMDGEKRGGMTWVGGNWLAAPHICCDRGAQANPDNAVYTAAVFEKDGDGAQSEVRINALQKKNLYEVRQVKRIPIFRDWKGPGGRENLLGGVAVHNRRLALSLKAMNAIWFVNADDGSVVEKIENVPSPRGIAYHPVTGALYVVTGNRLCRVQRTSVGKNRLVQLVASGLDEPAGLTLDAAGNLYVADRGREANQVKVFSPAGKLLRTVGTKGTIASGPYVAEQMRAPNGVAVDDTGRLWVAEDFNLPKRCSLWSATGKLLRTWFGHAKYGEGGTLDAHDPTKWYYAEGNGMMAFDVDWQKGETKLASILAYGGDFDFNPPGGYGGWGAFPERATYHAGRRYLNNSYNNCPVSAPSTMSMYTDCGNGRMRPCVSMGDAGNWDELKKDAYKGCWPDPNSRSGFYIWCDRNNDGRVQAAELKIYKKGGGVPLVQNDMSVNAIVDGKAVQMKPRWVPGCEAPLYALEEATVLCNDVLWSPSDGGNYVLTDAANDLFALANSAKPFHSHSFAGGRAGKAQWSYPTLWPGLHASHSAPVPRQPGDLIGTVRVMGPLMRPRGSEVAPVWLMSGNCGSVYAFTQDGLFITSVFGDERQRHAFAIPDEKRRAPMDGLTIHGENFWTTATCTEAGDVFMTCRCKLLRLNGFDTLRTIPPFKLTVTAKNLADVRDYHLAVERQRKAREGGGIVKVPLLAAGKIAIDGAFDDWKDVVPVNIMQQGSYAWFDSNSQPFDLRGRLAVSGDRLCAMWNTANRDLLRNTGENPQAPFKTGGCLDLMLGVNASADPNRREPVAGDLRLLVTEVDGKTRALLYRPKVAGTDKKRPVLFESPVRKISFDRVDDVSDQVQLAKDDKGHFELSVPLATLGLKPRQGLRLKADLGVLRGEDGKTKARHYWSNKSTAIVNDVPSEAELQPGLWGLLEFVSASDRAK